MTRYDDLLCEALLREIRGRTPREAAARLLETGLADRRACEARAIRSEVVRLCREGLPRCGALLRTAEQFNCSYEKVRWLFYGK